ncbi:MAG: PIN domain-containing protein [Caldimonas sp.]
MSARFLLVDLESVQPVPGDVETWLTQAGSAWVFHGPHQTKMLPRYAALGERVTLVPISRPGKNSLDFHLVFYLGYLSARNPNAKFAVLSKDSGYDPAIAHALTLAFDLLRIEHLGPVAAAATQPVEGVKKSTSKKQAAHKMQVAPKPPAAQKKKGASAKKAVPAKKPAVVAKKVIAKKATPSSEAAAPAKKPAPVKVAKASTPRVALIYRDVLRGLRARISNRPRSPEALERYVQTMIGVEPSPTKVRAVVDRLFTVEAVRPEGRRLVYFPNDPKPVPRPSQATPLAAASAAQL